MRIFSLIPAIATLAALSAPLAAQTGTITGTVTDSDGQPIEGVRVLVEGTSHGNVTRASGAFAILNVPAGVYTVGASMPGYSPVRIPRVNVSEGGVFAIQITLSGIEQQRPEVRLFPVQHLSNSDAAKLVAPFVEAARGGVFEAGDAVRGITVRGSPDLLARVDSLLKEHDQPRYSLRLDFRVVAALDSNVRDPRLAPIEAALRSALPYEGYQLITQSVLTVSAREFSTTMTTGDETYALSGRLGDVAFAEPTSPSGQRRVVSAPMSVRLHVRRHSSGSMQPLISTELVVPVGQTVVIGTGSIDGARRAIILVVGSS